MRSSAGPTIGNIAPQTSAAVSEGARRGIVGRRSFGNSTTIELGRGTLARIGRWYDDDRTLMKTLLQPTPGEMALPAVMGALSDPVRVAIVRALAEQGETVCGTLALGVSKATR